MCVIARTISQCRLSIAVKCSSTAISLRRCNAALIPQIDTHGSSPPGRPCSCHTLPYTAALTVSLSCSAVSTYPGRDSRSGDRAMLPHHMHGAAARNNNTALRANLCAVDHSHACAVCNLVTWQTCGVCRLSFMCTARLQAICVCPLSPTEGVSSTARSERHELTEKFKSHTATTATNTNTTGCVRSCTLRTQPGMFRELSPG